MPRQTRSRDAFGAGLLPSDFAQEDAPRGFRLPPRKRGDAQEGPASTSKAKSGGASFSELYESDKRSTRIKTLALVLVIMVLTVFSLTLGYEQQGTALMRHYGLLDVFDTVRTVMYVNVGQLFGFVSDAEAKQLAMESGMFYDESHRMMQTALVLVGSMLISVAGMLFQIVFKNPIASPTILGVQSGVNVGRLIMVVIFGASAIYMTELRFVFSYIGGVVTLAIVFAFGIITSSEKGSFEIKNMLLAGVMLSQLFGVFVSVLSSSAFSPEIHEAMLRLNYVTERSDSPFAFAVTLLTAVVTMIPLLKYRFRLNLLSVSDEEMRVGGLNPMRTRALVLVAGSLMILAAQSAIGGISMASLVIPFLARAIFGVEFRKQLLGCVLIGMVLVMVCYIVASLIPFVGSGISMTLIASVILVPLYAWIMATNERALEL